MHFIEGRYNFGIMYFNRTLTKPLSAFRTSLSFILISLLTVSSSEAQNLKLWYKQPAKEWVEALPLGNGRIGAMVFGGVEDELIQLNESTLWSGGPVSASVNPNAYSHLADIREALLVKEDYAKADSLTRKMQGLFTQAYLPLGDIMIHQNFTGNVPKAYHRELDLERAIATTSFSINGVRYVRQVFTSAPDSIMVIRFTASSKSALNFDLSASSQLHHGNASKGNAELIVNGKAPVHVNPDYHSPEGTAPISYGDTTGCKGMRFQFRMKAVSGDGKITVDTSGIHVRKATEVLIYVSAATSFNGFDKCPDKDGKDEKKIASDNLTRAMKKTFPDLQQRHLTDYKKFFSRVKFILDDTASSAASLPSDERLKAYTAGAEDPGLETLYFQFGRYLLISCSRPGGPAANLQGIWNKELQPPWSSNYTININTEMNYWPAELTNLSEMHQPLFGLIKNLTVTGAKTAQEFYHAKGWVAHHNSEIWATSNPVGDLGDGDPVWASWPMGGNWLSRHLYEHYAFTGDEDFLRRTAYPIMKEAARFTLDWLVEDKNGFLVTAPSTTPENKFKDSTGKELGVSVATAMDMEIIWDLFTNLIKSSLVLDTDEEFRNLLIFKRSKLLPLKVGSQGQLLEWYKEFQETDPKHRHASHLYGLYPGTQITPATPELFGAAKKTLAIRGDGGTGWSRGWKINWWARLLDGDHAYKLIRQLLTYVSGTKGSMTGGGTYPNFFDAHPPFQIDGNFAGTAGMAEMLIQSHLGPIQLLPALPSKWKKGSVQGLVARGAFEVGMKWDKNELTQGSVKSLQGHECILQSSVPLKVTGVDVTSKKIGDVYETSFKTEKGKSYTVSVVK